MPNIPGAALSTEGRHEVKFHWDDPGAMSGFDFQAHSGCVELAVTSQGVAAPELVRVGPNGTVAQTLPARVCR